MIVLYAIFAAAVALGAAASGPFAVSHPVGGKVIRLIVVCVLCFLLLIALAVGSIFFVKR